MKAARRQLQYLNWARAVAVTTLLVAAFTIEVLFVPQRPLDRLYVLAGGGYGLILLYVVLDHGLRARRYFAPLQVAGDGLFIAAFVVATGGALSPVSFLFAVPVTAAAALWGRRAGTAAALAAWALYGAIVLRDVLRFAPSDLPRGRVLYAVVSHLLGFVVIGLLGGLLADRLRAADREIAEHKGSLAALRAQHEQIVESINTGILTTDPAGAITFVNRAGFEILHQSPEDLVGRPVAGLFGLRPEFLDQASEANRSGRRFRFERTWIRPGGDQLLLGFAVAPLRSQRGRPEGWLVVFQDLTEMASLEAQVRTRERMAALGEMAAGMAHELRNPLAAISGCVQVIATGATGERSSLVDVTLRETERLNRIIRDFLEFARPGPFRPRPLDLVALVEELARLFRKSPEFTSAHRIEVRGAPGTFALADPDRVRQVFWNLAGNALKAMPEGGLLTIEVGWHGGDQVLLSFRDQGEGMDEETLARLFQPFHGRFKGGAGLGAAIVYRIAEEHRGHVQVISRRGHGTEVRVILPAAAADAPAATVPAFALAGGERS